MAHTPAEPYACVACDATGLTDDYDTCEPCDGVGITAIDCPGCGRRAVPIHETVFVAAHPRTYCERCGDDELARIRAHRRLSRAAFR